MKVFNHKEVEAAEVKDEGASKLKVRWLITNATGARNFAMRLFEMDPGGFSPLHNHPWEHEVFVLEGKGYVISGEEEKAFKEGDVIFISPNETHRFKNDGEEKVRFLCLIPYTN